MMLMILVLIFKFILSIILGLLFTFVFLIIIARYTFEPLRKGRCTCKTSLIGKTALITGGNSGIGLETARNLAKRGARVIIASTNVEKSKEAVEDIKKTTGNNNVEYKPLDLTKLSDVRRFATEFNDEEKRLDILVINAGCAGMKKKLTEDNIHIVVQINYVAHFLLTNLLLDKLIISKPSRIVIVSSTLHKLAKLNPLDVAGVNLADNNYFQPYNNSKLCQILWAKALAKKLPEEVFVNSLHPGVVKTNIFDRMQAIRKKILFFFIDIMFKNAEEGAQTTIHLCVSPAIKRSGDYYMDCKKYEASNKCLDEALVSKVWDETMKLVQN